MITRRQSLFEMRLTSDDTRYPARKSTRCALSANAAETRVTDETWRMFCLCARGWLRAECLAAAVRPNNLRIRIRGGFGLRLTGVIGIACVRIGARSGRVA